MTQNRIQEEAERRYKAANEETPSKFVKIFQKAFTDGGAFGYELANSEKSMALKETRLALYILIRCFKNNTQSAEQRKFMTQAEYILQKHFDVTDVLRDEPPIK